MSSTELAVAVHQAASKHAARQRQVETAEVLKTAPLKIEMHTRSTVLTDDDFDLSAWMSFYDEQFGIAQGDTVLLTSVQGEWIVFDVLGDDVQASQASAIKALTDRIERLEKQVFGA